MLLAAGCWLQLLLVVVVSCLGLPEACGGLPGACRSLPGSCLGPVEASLGPLGALSSLVFPWDPVIWAS